jgi:ferrochelatase
MQSSFDALLLVSFGGPEGMQDVEPFLENVLRGRQVPNERKKAVAHHYELFGGVSPINEQNRQLIEALKKEFQNSNIDLPIYWGNRNWHPMLENTVRQMAEDGIKNALAFVTSAYASYSGCRQYQENIENARMAVGPKAPLIHKLRLYFNHPQFIEANIAHLQTALNEIPSSRRPSTSIIFSAHSIPLAMAESCSYEAQLNEAARLVTSKLNINKWKLVFQSRSGPPNQPWLAPDVNDYIKELKEQNVTDIVILPIGFVSDHMEVIYDLDYEAKDLCHQLGINLMRAATAGIHPSFVSMIKNLVLERTSNSAHLAMGELPCPPDYCAPDCCPSPSLSLNRSSNQTSHL